VTDSFERRSLSEEAESVRLELDKSGFPGMVGGRVVVIVFVKEGGEEGEPGMGMSQCTRVSSRHANHRLGPAAVCEGAQFINTHFNWGVKCE
jgi:hypothetical protein